MFKTISNWFFNIQSCHGILQEKDRRLYEYAYRLLLSRIIIYFLIVMFGFATGNWLEMLCFLLPFIILREYAGGFHFKNSGICLLLSGSIVLGSGQYLAFDPIMTKSFGIGWIPTLFIIFGLTPVDTKNKKLDKAAKKVYGKRTRVILLIECVAAIFFWKIKISLITKGIILSHIVLAIGLVLGKSQNFFLYKLEKTNAKGRK